MEEQNKLIARAMAGDKDAFQMVCMQKGRHIIYLCAQKLGNLMDGEDAAQEVFIRMYKGITCIKAPEAFASWMYRIIQNVCNDMRRNKMKNSNLPVDDYCDLIVEDNADYLPQAYVENDEKRRQLMEIINGLSHNMRMCIILFYFERLPQAGVAEVLSLSINTVDTYLNRARKKIRVEMEARYPAHPGETMIPMAALGLALQQDAYEQIPQDVVSRCFNAAQRAIVLPGGQPKVLPKSLTAFCSLMLAGAMVLTTMFALSSNQFTSFSGSSAPALDTDTLYDPQRIGLSMSESMEAGDMANSLFVASPEALSSGQALPGPDVQTPGSLLPHEPPSSADDTMPTPNHVPTTSADNTSVVQNCQGIILLKDEDGKEIPQSGLYAQGFSVVLLLDDRVVDTATVDKQGGYTIAVPPSGTAGHLVLRVRMGTMHSYIFTQDNPMGELEIPLPMQPHVPTVYITDNQPPALSIRLYNAQGHNSSINPTKITVLADDATEVQLMWEITSQNGAVLYSGTSNINEALAQLQSKHGAGRYLVTVTATDVTGNQTTQQQELLFIK